VSGQGERSLDQPPQPTAKMDGLPGASGAACEGSERGRPVRRYAELCADHLGDTVHALAAWAREQGFQGKVTVLAIDQPAPSQADSPALPGDRTLRGFAFGTILLNL
jgi:hypothetical protein